MNYRFGESLNLLFFREVWENWGLVYDIYIYFEIINNIKILYIYIVVVEENIEEVKKVIDEIFDNVINGKIKIGERDFNIMKKVYKIVVILILEDLVELCNYMLY